MNNMTNRTRSPQRGFTAKMSATFMEEGKLRITGTVMGLSGHFIWKKLE